MKVAVSSNGAGLDAEASPVFGRCPTYVFVDPESMEAESVDNPAMNAAGGAGIQAAQFIVERGAEAVISGNLGPNAFDVFESAGVPVYLFGGGSVRQAIEAHKGGQLSQAGTANVQAHAGIGRGRGTGRGMGRGRARRVSPDQAQAAPASPEEEIAALKDMAADLRSQLAEVTDRMDRLEERE
jgi:predicted Fe-Mo cluster-binding NifX family protein